MNIFNIVLAVVTFVLLFVAIALFMSGRFIGSIYQHKKVKEFEEEFKEELEKELEKELKKEKKQ